MFVRKIHLVVTIIGALLCMVTIRMATLLIYKDNMATRLELSTKDPIQGNTYKPIFREQDSALTGSKRNLFEKISSAARKTLATIRIEKVNVKVSWKSSLSSEVHNGTSILKQGSGRNNNETDNIQTLPPRLKFPATGSNTRIYSVTPSILKNGKKYQLTRTSSATTKSSTSFSIISDSLHNSKDTSRERQHLILLYTPLFDRKPWPSVPIDYNFTDLDGTRCPYHNCKLTYDQRLLNDSDVVIFHGRDLPEVNDMRELRKNNLQQKWIFFMHESPENSYFVPTEYNDLFNWTMTYRGDSDIYVPYHGWRRKAKVKNIEKDFAAGKTKLVSFVNSHCDDTRMQFIRNLKKYIDVDVYGRCAQFFEEKVPDCPRNSKVCDDIQKKYKFYLAYENGFCRDYITEKYWINGLKNGLVPIVLGGANYSDDRIAIQGSFIDAMKFKSLRDLASYLHYLSKNDTAYNEYHKWRSNYEIVQRDAMCFVCEQISKDSKNYQSVNMVDFWDPKLNCKDRSISVEHFLKDQ